MISLGLCLAALVGTFAAARRSLPSGLGVLLLVGYVYGIVRANQLDGYSHLLFDSALCGLYAAQFLRPLSLSERIRLQDLRTWLFVLMGWPIVLFLAPRQDILIELVGLRGNIFMLPCLLLGARLSREDLGELAAWVAALNIAAGVMALVQFVVGIEVFFPRNQVTRIIYASGDVANYTAYRIPSTFQSAHAYGGTMIMTMPLLFGAWTEATAKSAASFRSRFLLAALAVSSIAVFVAGARAPVLQLLAIGGVAFMSGEVKMGQRARWLLVGLLVAWVVAGQARLQRFTTLSDPEFLAERIAGSVNLTFLELATRYPLGNGLGGGGTSVPFFLQARVRNSVAMENEYARILMEEGIPGLTAWLLFLFWLFTRRLPPDTPWPLARVLVRVATASAFALGLLGIGLLTSIPGTAVMLIAAGWSAVPAKPEEPQTVAVASPSPFGLQYGVR